MVLDHHFWSRARALIGFELLPGPMVWQHRSVNKEPFSLSVTRLGVIASFFAVAFLLVGCGQAVDNGQAFLLRYAARWQATPVAGQSLPYATPGPGGQPIANAGLTRPVGQAGPGGTAAPNNTIKSSQTTAHALVFLDPGHGGVDEGTSGTTETGERITEKAMTLSVALRTASILRADGIPVALSRENDSLPGLPASAYTADGTLLTADGVLEDLQRRIDEANASGASVFLSMHFNAFSDPSVGGTETFYDSTRTFGSENLRFATLVQNSVISDFHQHGYDVPDRGVTDDNQLQAESLGTLPSSYNHLVVLGPELPGRLRPTNMPGALCEGLFLSNPQEATLMSQPAVQDLLARAYADAIEKFLNGRPPQ